jgi:hypothetical protein
MIRRPALAALAAAGLAGCTQTAEISPGVTLSNDRQALAPGDMRFGIAGLDSEKWSASIRQGAPDGSLRLGFTCKVLACPDPVAVIVTTRRSPAERPDAKALEKLAKETIPKLTQAESLQLQVRTDNKAKVDTLSSVATRIRDYPAVLNETRVTAPERQSYIAIATLFAGKLLVTVRTEAGDRAAAKAALDDFTKAITIEEGPPAP